GVRAALAGEGRLGAGDVPDRAVAEVEEVADGQAGAFGLVGVDHAVAVSGVGVDHDHDGGVGRELHGAGVEQVDLHDGDDGVDGQLVEPGEGAQHVVLGGDVDGDQGDRVALGGGVGGDGLDGPAVAGGVEVEEDHADGVELPVSQRAGGAVGPVAELPHGGEHLLAGGAGDAGAAVGDPGDGLGGHAGE